ncbi:protein kinase, putative [Bodo saltans]|uniref:Protein kinase, putative n=1 Tax=Bodo saltans TaxID=75058 RepID=A0A0S4JBY3_BODSA|nr:protein kinase, putative [Bodo saltans]|eukprot:CUG86709.1 protein kinase, putative [Bodo saltans]
MRAQQKPVHADPSLFASSPSHDGSVRSSNPIDHYLLLVRLDGKVQCIDLTTGLDAWCISLEGGTLCSYEQSTAASSSTTTSTSPQQQQDIVAGLPSTVMLGGFKSLDSATHTYILSTTGDLVLADDHRLLNGDLLVHNMAAFNATDSNYVELSLRCGSIMVEGVDDVRQMVLSPLKEGSSGAEDIHHPTGPVLAIVRHNRRHTGRFRSKSGSEMPARSWKFKCSAVTVVDLDSPSLKMLPAADGTGGSVMLLNRSSDDVRSVSSAGNSPTAFGIPSFPSTGAAMAPPPMVEVFVDGTWRVRHRFSQATTRSSSFGGTGSGSSQPAPLWLSGTVEDSEIVKAYHFCSYFNSIEKLHEVPVGIFDDGRYDSNDGTSSSTGSTHARMGEFDDRQVYLKPERNFLFIVGDAPDSFPLRAFLDSWKKNTSSTSPAAIDARSGTLTANRKQHPVINTSDVLPLGAVVEQCDNAAWRFRYGTASPTSATVKGFSLQHRAPNQVRQVPRIASTANVETITTSSELNTTTTTSLKGTTAFPRTNKVKTETISSGTQRAADLFLLQDDSSSCDDDANDVSERRSCDSSHKQITGGPGPRSSSSTSSTDLDDNSDYDQEEADSVDSRRPMTGKLFFDENFEPLRILGMGVSGVVVLCRHKVTTILYAVKIVIVQSKLEEEEVLREVKLHASVMSDNVVRYHSCWTEVITRKRTMQVKALVDAEEGNDGNDTMLGVDSISDYGTEDDDDERSADTVSSTVSSLSRNVGKKALMLQMEYCNTTLAVRLTRRRCMDRVENLSVAIQLINGVAHLHSRGIVHRDLKPSNIMLLIDDSQETIDDCVLTGDIHAFRRHQAKVEASQNSRQNRNQHRSFAIDNDDDSDDTSTSDDDDDMNGDHIYVSPYTVKVGDLGLAKAEGDRETEPAGYFSHTELHTMGVGSPLYSSPEQLEGTTCQAQSDVFSIGMVIAEAYLKPSTVSERLTFLTQVRNRMFPQAMLEAFPELKVARAMLHPTPEKRLPLIKAKKRLRKVLGTLVRLQ